MTAATVELPVLCEATGNTLVTVGTVGKGNQRTHLTAIWRTPRGNIMHQVTPFTTDLHTKAEAAAYALECPQTWQPK